MKITSSSSAALALLAVSAALMTAHSGAMAAPATSSSSSAPLKERNLLDFLPSLPAIPIPFFDLGREVLLPGLGKVVGNVDTNGRSFKSIPYGTAARFAPPEPYVTPFTNGTLDSRAYPLRCPQIDIKGPIAILDRKGAQSDACLNLAVFTPPKSTGENLPVMVYFIGGAFVSGDIDYIANDGPSLMARQEKAIIVIFNFRAGAYGLLGGDKLSAASGGRGSGNMMIQDSLLALQWVQKYIQQFNGNKKNVTVYGNSSGATVISYLLSLPEARGLFNRAILQSGGAGTSKPKTIAEANAQFAKFAEINGCATAADQIACLRSLTIEQMNNNTAAAGMRDDWRPTLDGVLVREDPRKVIAEGRGNPIDGLIAGAVKDEGLAFVPPALLPRDAAGFARLIAEFNARGHDLGDKTELARLYDPANFGGSFAEAANRLYGDNLFECPVLEMAQAYRQSSTPVYVYRWMQNVIAFGIFGDVSQLGVAHTSELAYTFGALSVIKTPAENRLSSQSIRYWTRFAELNSPNDEANSKDFVWPKMGPKGTFINFKVADGIFPLKMNLTLDTLADTTTPYGRRCDFWKKTARYIV